MASYNTPSVCWRLGLDARDIAYRDMMARVHASVSESMRYFDEGSNTKKVHEEQVSPGALEEHREERSEEYRNEAQARAEALVKEWGLKAWPIRDAPRTEPAPENF